MENFTPVSAVLGGLLIGVAAALLLFANGRIAGVSGIVGGLLKPAGGEWGWRLAFVAGLVLGPLAAGMAGGEVPAIEVAAGWPVVVAGGLLVGFGTRLGSGCTSGHGVCGIARLSTRSLLATAIFMAAGALVVFLIRHVAA